MKKPEPMPDPCLGCDKSQSCVSAETYLCPRFCEAFVQAWDETAAWLREALHP